MPRPGKLKKEAPPKKKEAPAKRKPPTKKAKPVEPVEETAQVARQYDLDALSQDLGAPNAAFAERTFAAVREEGLVSNGTRIDSQSLIDDAPRFVGSAIEILRSLSSEQRRKVRLPDAIFPLLVAEIVQLRKLKLDFDAGIAEAASGKAERDTAARRAMREGIAERDLCYYGLRNALGEDRMPEVDAIVGRADTPEHLAQGLEALAGFIEKTIVQDKDAAASIEDYGVGATCAKDLRARAVVVRKTGKTTAAPGRRVSQRALDLQDGRVVLLLEKVLRAFRAARRADPAILVPELSRTAWMFEIRSGRRAPAANGEGASAAAATAGGS